MYHTIHWLGFIEALLCSAGDEHYAVARGVQKVLQDYKNLQVSLSTACSG